MERIVNGLAVLLATLVASVSLASTTAPAQLVTDFTSQAASSFPVNFASTGDRAFFTASGPAFSSNLWVTDGTADGTVLLKPEGVWLAPAVLRPGQDSTVLFIAPTTSGRPALWKSDGTRSSTTPLIEFELATLSTLTVGDRIGYFAADDGVHGIELWRSDGSVDGTFMVKDLAPGSASGLVYGSQALFVDGKVFFMGTDPTAPTDHNIVALWQSDGTAEGTRLVKAGFEIEPSIGSFYDFTAFGARGFYYFVVARGDGDEVLWRSDGTEDGTVLLAHTNLLRLPSTGPTEPPRPFDVGGSILFFSRDALWVTDGSAAGTAPIKSGLQVTGATQLADRILFTACDPRESCGLWESDGTAIGTRKLVSIDVLDPVSRYCSDFTTSVPGDFVTTESRAYFFTPDPAGDGIALWSTDGTSGGTTIIRNGFLYAGPGAALGETVVFNADDSAHGSELWITQGTAGTTNLLHDVAPGSIGGVALAARAGQHVVFTAPIDLCNDAMVSFDTSTGQTQVLLDGGLFFDKPVSPISHEWLLVSRSGDYTVDSGIYITKGTPATTQFIAEDHGGIWAGDRAVYFYAFNSFTFHAIDRYGTASRLIASGLDSVQGVAEYGDRLLFLGQSPTALWSSLGTFESTRQIRSFDGKEVLHDSLIVAGEVAYFTTFEYSDATTTLWRTDATADGTVALHTFPDQPYRYMHPREFVSVGRDVFFTNMDAEHGRELWRVRGDTVELVRDLNPGPAAGAGALIAADGRIFFVGDDTVHGRELWTSDGTDEGTRLVRDILPGRGSGLGRSEVKLINHILVFGADDGNSGFELWRSDGTGAGTIMVQEILPGPLSSEPNSFVAVGPDIYFGAEDGVHGRELWRIPASAIGGECAADCDGNFEVTVDEIVRSVSLALDRGELSACAAADVSDDGMVTADEIILGVTNLLRGCS